MRTLVLTALALTFGCAADSSSILLELKTDFAPGVSFDAVSVRLDDGTREFAIPPRQNTDGRVLVGEITGLAERDYRMDVVLLDGPTELIRSGELIVQVGGRTGVTVLLTRDCLGVACPDAQRCVRATCADRRCIGGSEGEFCPEAECSLDTQCPPATTLCAEAQCIEGICLELHAQDGVGSCGANEVCIPDEGCFNYLGDLPIDGDIDASGFFPDGAFDFDASF